MKNKEEEMKDIEGIYAERPRNFFILLYPETESYNYNDVLRYLKGFKDWAYIEHQPEENEKKRHVHFFLHLENGSEVKALSKKSGIPERFIVIPRSVRSVNRYLIHIDDEDKTQYKREDVHVSKNWERQFNKFFKDTKTEEEIIIDIYSFIDNLIKESLLSDYPTIIKTLMLWSFQNCYEQTWKRYRNEFDLYIKSML